MTTAVDSTGARVEALHVYPVKGLSPQPLHEVELSAGRALPFDRVLALARPGGEYAPGVRRGISKRQFFVLVDEARLAGLRTHLDTATGVFTVAVREHEVLRADLRTGEGVRRVLELFARVLDLPAGVLPVWAHEEGRRFTDTAPGGDEAMELVSVLNLASVREFAGRVGAAVDPLRFRANVHVDGLPAWSELDLVGRKFTLGGVRVRGEKPTVRCAATEVEPGTGRRDLPVPQLLSRHHGREVMGLYVRVLSGGTLAVGGGVRG
ncbi:MOSC domain-containing protein [Kineococcus esterisolvens]|uniref:MOSC domain-containing protein n=1 Tax=unclassified Kineococcus TaxID=2621656 RepID=UPI003D7E82A6